MKEVNYHNYIYECILGARWYKEKDFESKLPPYYRDRLVEMHVSALAYFEPKYSRVRIMVAKLFAIQIVIDDTCNRYASLREVEILASAIERYFIHTYNMLKLLEFIFIKTIF